MYYHCTVTLMALALIITVVVLFVQMVDYLDPADVEVTVHPCSDVVGDICC